MTALGLGPRSDGARAFSAGSRRSSAIPI